MFAFSMLSMFPFSFALFSLIDLAASSSFSKHRAVPVPQIIPRQIATSTLNATPSLTSGLATGTPTASTAPLAINDTHINTTLVTIPVNHDTVSFICKNCSIIGDFSFGTEAFKVDFDPPQLSGGILTMVANGFGGEFEVEVVSAALSKKWSHTLYRQAIDGFGIPGLVDAGVFVEINVVLEVEFEEEIDMVFGLDFRVPDGSYVNIDVIDPKNSSQHGFTYKTGLTFGTIPFSANVSTPSASISLSLEPSFLFEAHVELGSIDIVHADAGAFIDIPRLQLDVDPVTNVDAQCRAMNTSTHGPALAPALGNATNVVPSVELDLGLEADLSIGLIPIIPETGLTLLSVVTTLPTACLLWDQTGKTLAPATAVVAAVSSASSASAASAASAASVSSAVAASASAHANSAGAKVGSTESYVFNKMWVLGLSFILGCTLL